MLWGQRHIKQATAKGYSNYSSFFSYRKYFKILKILTNIYRIGIIFFHISIEYKLQWGLYLMLFKLIFPSTKLAMDDSCWLEVLRYPIICMAFSKHGCKIMVLHGLKNINIYLKHQPNQYLPSLEIVYLQRTFLIRIYTKYLHIYRTHYWLRSHAITSEYLRWNSSICKCLQMFGLKLNTYGYFHPHEVVGRGSETQLQLGKN